jgi:hypothetical protein
LRSELLIPAQSYRDPATLQFLPFWFFIVTGSQKRVAAHPSDKKAQMASNVIRRIDPMAATMSLWHTEMQLLLYDK